MKDEVAASVVFVTRLVKRNKKLTKDEVDKFSDKLTNILVDRFKNHWHTDKPLKGQAYRCIRINEFEPTDTVLQQAAAESGLNFHQLNLPSELTLWTDPSEVCCRFGETKGSTITVASFKNEKNDNHALTLNVEDMIEEYNKKRSEDIAKLREFTGKRSPVNTPPPGAMGPVYNKNMAAVYYHNMQQQQQHQTKWRNPHYNGNFNRPSTGRAFFGQSNNQMIRNDCVFYPQPSSSYDSGEEVVMDPESVISFPPPSMKTGHNPHPSNPSPKDRYRWVKGSGEAVKA